MKLATIAFAAAAFGSVFATPAVATSVVVTPSSGLWSNRADEAAVGATAAITNTAPGLGAADGSLELTGARTRFATGSIYPNAASPKIASLADAISLTFDWMIAGDSTNPYNPDYTPALRLHVFDAGSNSRKELIWEGAYNNVYGAQTVPDTWYSSSASDLFYITGGDVNQGKTIADWAQTLAAGSFVAGISIGDGGGAGAYHAFADNVAFTTTAGTTTFDFATDAVSAAPEPATWGMMILGFGVIGAALRHRRRSAAFAAA